MAGKTEQEIADDLARERFGWSDGDVLWPDGKGGFYTNAEVEKIQADAAAKREAEAAARPYVPYAER